MYYVIENTEIIKSFVEQEEALTFISENEGTEILDMDYMVDPNLNTFKQFISERRLFLRRTSSHKGEDMYTNTSVRNAVLFYVDAQGSVTKTDLIDFIKTKLATKRGKPVHRSWIHKFARYFKVKKSGKQYKFSLSSLGKNVIKKLKSEGLSKSTPRK